uniref:Uncharacterized protein n=1 Tax=Rhizophora mucronata TaxID=61149 RepID=A0A2P2NCN7_RHIMU
MTIYYCIYLGKTTVLGQHQILLVEG